MINDDGVGKCYGCMACMEICPKKSITKCMDKEGFPYPEVHMESCIHCDKCESVCPQIKKQLNETQKVYGLKHKNQDVRQKATSGGAFGLLAKSFMVQGGVVFASGFDEDWYLKYYELKSNNLDLEKFMGSKYIQSDFGDSYKKIEECLLNNKKVLVIGTPCQIQGVRNYFGGEKKIYLVDLFCHGVPGPNIWKTYLKKRVGKKKLQSYYFRNKDLGWHNSGVKYCIDGREYHKKIGEDLYSRLYFVKGMVRESCYHCQFKNQDRVGDITLGDFWGIESVDKEFDDDGGVSLMCVNTEKGFEMWDMIYTDCVYKEYSKMDISPNNFKEREMPKNYYWNKRLYERFPAYGTLRLIGGYAKKVILLRLLENCRGICEKIRKI